MNEQKPSMSLEEMRAQYPPLMDTKQAAQVLNVTPRMVQKLCKEGDIKAVMVKTLWRVNRDELFAFAAGQAR